MDLRLLDATCGTAATRLKDMQADCLEEEEVQRRKAEMERLMAAGLRVFTFPEAIVNAITDAMHGLSHSPAAVSPTAGATALPPPPQTAAGPAFRLPFNVVAGNHADVSVHNFWFVRVYRCATSALSRCSLPLCIQAQGRCRPGDQQCRILVRMLRCDEETPGRTHVL